MIPKGFTAKIEPLSLNYVDQEKIIALLQDKMKKFATQFMKQQQFAIGVKIFPFDNRVVSLHLIVVRIEWNPKGADDEDDDDGVQERKPAAESKKAEPDEA